MSHYGFKPYVSVAKRREKASRKMKKLRKKGMEIFPIEIEKRKIAKTFWGKAWCDHIESFSDYDNRLPRGRTYVRNGSVCHLAINKGCVEAIVSGSELYNVRIQIEALPSATWKTIKKSCAGKISSLLDLLSGQLSDGIMQVVCDRNEGLFPLANEIKLNCDCPDWATMCKHVAAVLYGVGARLDHSPEKLFELRDVAHDELIDTTAVILDTTQDTGSRRRRIDQSDISGVFDIEIAADVTSKKPPSALPKYFSGANVRKKREALNLTKAALARQIGVTAQTISNWENKGRKKLNLRAHVKTTLEELWSNA